MSIELRKIAGELPILKDGKIIKETIGIFNVNGRRWFLWSDIYGIMTERKKKMARWNANLGRKPQDIPKPKEFGFIDGEDEEDWILSGVSQSKGRGGGCARWLVSRHVRDQMFALFSRFAIAQGDEPEDERAPPRLPRRRVIELSDSEESEESEDSESELEPMSIENLDPYGYKLDGFVVADDE